MRREHIKSDGWWEMPGEPVEALGWPGTKNKQGHSVTGAGNQIRCWLQGQVDDLERVADLDARFRELSERVGELEKTKSLKARFTKLANEAKRGPEILHSELLAKVERLQHQIDNPNKFAAQPGPQGPRGPPGKLPRVKEYAARRVHYEADIVVHAGALWQAHGDTVHAPPHADWICVARAGRNGCDVRSPNVCGTYDARDKTSGVTLLCSMALPSLLGAMIRESVPAMAGNC